MTVLDRASATACANIALAKYWGKVDVRLNLPAVPSVSMTLAGMRTHTTVEVVPELPEDTFELNGKTAGEKETARVTAMLDRIRRAARRTEPARVSSRNDFPTASGLASSASGFAALAAAAAAAYGLRATPAQLSAFARASSASAARSIFGGFVLLPKGRAGEGRLAAKPLHDVSHWDVRMVVAVLDEGPKDVGSTDGMERSRHTSPLYEGWVDAAPSLCRKVQRALAARDLEALGVAMEQSTVAFHAVAMSSAPPTFYWKGATLDVLQAVFALRARGTLAYATMDAGPHVKVLCAAQDAVAVARALGRVPGVKKTLVTEPGPGVVVDRR